ncbi:MAG: hypothetical protein JO328_03285 [Hyphomicrobiales bacterium]|nr:hypothetical protein [Hyphomicrobiales bacterium]MBV9428162.1 hypothetical protein [Bradyrhizobiaceae bacterium]
MKRVRKRPRGFYARIARARGVAVGAIYLELNPDKWPCVRAQHECDATWPWSQQELARMDRAFCNAVLREIARGTEQARGPAPKPAAGRARRAPPLLRCAASRDRRG